MIQLLLKTSKTLIRQSNSIDDQGSQNNLYIYILLSTTILAAFLRLWNLEVESLRLDEAQSVWQASHTLEFIKDYMLKNVHLPLHNTLLHVWIKLFGGSEVSVRFLSAIFGILNIPAIYALSSRILGKRRALFTAFIASVSPFLVWYSREIRMYSLLFFVTTLSYYFYLKILKSSGRSSYIFYILVNIAGIYTHYFFMVVLLIQGLFFLFYWKVNNGSDKVKKIQTSIYLLIAQYIQLIAFLPWLQLLIKEHGEGAYAPSLDKPNSFNIVLSFFEFTFGYQPESYTSFFLSLWPVFILLAFIFLNKRKINPVSPEIMLAILGTFLPVLLIYFVSITYRPVYLTRYLTPVVPLFLVVLTWFLTEMTGKIRTILISVFLLVIVLSLLSQFFNPANPAKEHYKEAVDFVDQNATLRDIVVISPPYTLYPIKYYYNGESAVNTMPIWEKRKEAIPPSINDPLVLQEHALRLGTGYKRIFLILTTNLKDSEEIWSYFEHNYKKLDERQFSRNLKVYVYKVEYL